MCDTGAGVTGGRRQGEGEGSDWVSVLPHAERALSRHKWDEHPLKWGGLLLRRVQGIGHKSVSLWEQTGSCEAGGAGCHSARWQGGLGRSPAPATPLVTAHGGHSSRSQRVLSRAGRGHVGQPTAPHHLTQHLHGAAEPALPSQSKALHRCVQSQAYLKECENGRALKGGSRREETWG